MKWRRRCWDWGRDAAECFVSVAGAESGACGERTGENRQKKGGPVSVDDLLKARLSDLREKGFNRLYQNGRIFEFSTPESLLDINFAEPVYLVVDALQSRQKSGRDWWMRLRAATARLEKSSSRRRCGKASPNS